MNLDEWKLVGGKRKKDSVNLLLNSSIHIFVLKPLKLGKKSHPSKMQNDALMQGKEDGTTLLSTPTRHPSKLN